MVEFKAVISDPKSGKCFSTTVGGHQANSLVGKSIGDEVDGGFVNLPFYKLIITGGSDRAGFPMRKDISGSRRMGVLVAKSIGFQKVEKGVRKKRTFCGRTISPDITQINMKVTTRGNKEIEELLAKGADEEKKEE